MVDIENIRIKLEKAWDKSTAVDQSEWSIERPSIGQCAVTALLIHKLYDGKILRAKVNGESHYWNRLPNRVEVDFTSDQFDNMVYDSPVEERSRIELLANENTKKRYLRLAQNYYSVW